MKKDTAEKKNEKEKNTKTAATGKKTAAKPEAGKNPNEPTPGVNPDNGVEVDDPNSESDLSPGRSKAADPPGGDNDKTRQLDERRVDGTDDALTTNQGLKMAEDEFSLTAGDRGPTLMEDFHFREKITHFDHERIPERVVHARGTGAHGVFTCYEPLTKYTKAHFLSEAGLETPVFVRFSTVAGFRGSADAVRDVRGFSTKFYTQEGNYDLVGNNMPVFFIQDAIKFPDLIHAVKPEPHNEMPQASSAHDTFWDFIVSNPESTHQMFWALSDRGIPRSLRMMEGFGIHTFRFVNAEGQAHFVKFHWKPMLGVHQKVWDEAQKTNGKDPDFHRRDLMDAIDSGAFPEWELGVQILAEEDEFSLDFDILDPTKIWPEEDVPVKIIGKMTLNRNVDNFFAEVEQSAFHPGHIVPGIDFTNDPLLQGRLFSYTDTQLIRLGGPNFHQIPINMPIVPVRNNQRDGYHQHDIHQGATAYHKNSLNDNWPRPVPQEEGGFEFYQEKVEGRKIRNRSESFEDFYSQAVMFYNSLTKPEQEHLRDALIFELQMVESMDLKEKMTETLAKIDRKLAEEVALPLGTVVPDVEPVKYDKVSPAVSMENTTKKPDTLKVAIWITDGFDSDLADTLEKKIKDSKAVPVYVSYKLGMIKGSKGEKMAPKSYLTAASPLFDAAILIGGEKPDAQLFDTYFKDFTSDIFNHFKPLAVHDSVKDWLPEAVKLDEPGVMAGKDLDPKTFIENLTQMRFWDRKVK